MVIIGNSHIVDQLYTAPLTRALHRTHTGERMLADENIPVGFGETCGWVGGKAR